MGSAVAGWHGYDISYAMSTSVLAQGQVVGGIVWHRWYGELTERERLFSYVAAPRSLIFEVIVAYKSLLLSSSLLSSSSLLLVIIIICTRSTYSMVSVV